MTFTLTIRSFYGRLSVSCVLKPQTLPRKCSRSQDFGSKTVVFRSFFDGFFSVIRLRYTPRVEIVYTPHSTTKTIGRASSNGGGGGVRGGGHPSLEQEDSFQGSSRLRSDSTRKATVRVHRETVCRRRAYARCTTSVRIPYTRRF